MMITRAARFFLQAYPILGLVLCHHVGGVESKINCAVVRSAVRSSSPTPLIITCTLQMLLRTPLRSHRGMRNLRDCSARLLDWAAGRNPACHKPAAASVTPTMACTRKRQRCCCDQHVPVEVELHCCKFVAKKHSGFVLVCRPVLTISA